MESRGSKKGGAKEESEEVITSSRMWFLLCVGKCTLFGLG